MPSERYPNVDVTGDSQPRDVPFRVRAEKLRDFSPDSPARVRGSFENCSSMEQTVGFGPIQPFSTIWCEGECLLVVIPIDREIQRYALGTDEQIIPDEPVEGCWETNIVRLIRHDVLRWQSLDAGECIQTEYAVLHYPEQEILEATTDKWVGSQSESDDCLQAGEYRFEESFQPKFGTKATWEEFTWGFTITIEE
ncbi:hypothetical protein DEQ92_02015 [Haloferax sp. Atlit-6N]|uniref:hypothetical protein n=1 Tax=Haloferax sp. Atlit-6N TaxID=2077205 RepID=UPI000E224D53|nr:hypothetical protein [Haloferax sp. Atlit-6N]REA05084.1 hypothetical protein DEQ92_02015 [Haloferax sp. Atlit-6N]